METSLKHMAENRYSEVEIAAGEQPLTVDSELNGPNSAESTRWLENFEAERDARLRLTAEYENYRRRTRLEIAGAVDAGKRAVLVQMLDFGDDLDIAVARLDGKDEWVEMMQRKFNTLLESNGVIGFKSVGTRFDPERHEAFDVITDSECESGTVHSEARRGYFLYDKLLRPALVIVAQ